MDKKEFIKQVKENIEDISLEDMKNIIIKFSNKIPSSLWKVMLSIIKDVNGTLKMSLEEIDLLKKEIYDKFDEIKNGEVCFNCYSYETGTYSYYEEDLDYHYYPTNEMDNILNRTYEVAVSFVLHKEYLHAIEMFNLILYTDYSCEEVGNPEFDNSDEVYDTFDINIKDARESLDFNLDTLYYYVIYSIIRGNTANKKEKIYEYIGSKNLDIRNVINIGIEEINNFDKFYEEWLDFLSKKK